MQSSDKIRSCRFIFFFKLQLPYTSLVKKGVYLWYRWYKMCTDCTAESAKDTDTSTYILQINSNIFCGCRVGGGGCFHKTLILLLYGDKLIQYNRFKVWKLALLLFFFPVLLTAGRVKCIHEDFSLENYCLFQNKPNYLFDFSHLKKKNQ